MFAAVTEPLVEELPSIEPEAISRELGLDGSVLAKELAARRRAFAFKNHPDRVAPHLRQRAMVRMQVANMLIDEARKAARQGTLRPLCAVSGRSLRLQPFQHQRFFLVEAVDRLAEALARRRDFGSSVPLVQPSMTSGWM